MEKEVRFEGIREEKNQNESDTFDLQIHFFLKSHDIIKAMTSFRIIPDT